MRHAISAIIDDRHVQPRQGHFYRQPISRGKTWARGSGQHQGHQIAQRLILPTRRHKGHYRLRRGADFDKYVGLVDPFGQPAHILRTAVEDIACLLIRQTNINPVGVKFSDRRRRGSHHGPAHYPFLNEARVGAQSTRRHASALKSSSSAAIRPASDCSMISRAQRAAERNSRLRTRCFTRGSEGEAMESSRMPRPMSSGA